MTRYRLLYAVTLLCFFVAGCETATPTSVEPTVEATDELAPTTEATESPAPTPLPDPTWWNDRVFYEVFVRSYYDSDGDGNGDISGLIEKLDYLNDGDPSTTDDLGVTGLWLMPVMESPSYHGYDVTDYRDVEDTYGTNEDFKRLIDEAHQRDIVVIVDLIMNHTSREHTWFVDSRQPDSEHADWYVWSDSDPGFNGPDGQKVWHQLGGRFYYAVFWDGMPDLNLSNAEVTQELYDISRFWLEDMGADGFRLDGAKHLIEKGELQTSTPETREWLADYHAYVHTVDPGALLVGEVWSPSFEIAKYVPDSFDMAFEFDLSEEMINGARSALPSALQRIQENVLEIYPEQQYAAFLSNHDQNRVMSQLAGDEEEAKLAASLLLTQPGVPFIYYGEEIGMVGEKPDERIRTPMQWTDTPDTAGFTSGRPWQALAENYADFNVASEADDPESLLNHYRTLIHLRNGHSALRRGDMIFVASASSRVYSFLRLAEDEVLLVIINLHDEEVTDYALSLESGLLGNLSSVEILFGSADASAPHINDAGGFDGYQPVNRLPPRSTLILKLLP